LGKKHVYGLKVLQGYRRALDPIDVQIFGKKNQGNKKVFEGGRKKCAT
jgi:hypothetical protein